MHGRSVLIRSTVGSFSKLLFARAACLRLIVRVQRACVGKDQTEGTEEDLAAEEDESLQFATPVLERSARWEMAARDSFKMSPREVAKIEANFEKKKNRGRFD